MPTQAELRVTCEDCGKSVFDASSLKTHQRDACPGREPTTEEGWRELVGRLRAENADFKRKLASNRTGALIDDVARLQRERDDLEAIVRASNAFSRLFPNAVAGTSTQTNNRTMSHDHPSSDE